jgi:hypothetical protein
MKKGEPVIVKLNCDKLGCGWSAEVEGAGAVVDWGLKPCPRCGTQILNEAELMLAKLLHTAERLGLVQGAGNRQPHVHINTANLGR